MSLGKKNNVILWFASILLFFLWVSSWGFRVVIKDDSCSSFGVKCVFGFSLHKIFCRLWLLQSCGLKFWMVILRLQFSFYLKKLTNKKQNECLFELWFFWSFSNVIPCWCMLWNEKQKYENDAFRISKTEASVLIKSGSFKL